MEISIDSKKFGKQLILIDDSDFQIVKDYKWHVVKIGYCMYAESCIGTKRIRMHRLILGLNHNELADHIDHNGLNNKRENLRKATKSQNAMNNRIKNNNSSGYKGVYFHNQFKKYHSQIKFNGKRHSLGLHNDALSAAKAYNEAAIKYYGEYANLNSI